MHTVVKTRIEHIEEREFDVNFRSVKKIAVDNLYSISALNNLTAQLIVV